MSHEDRKSKVLAFRSNPISRALAENILWWGGSDGRFTVGEVVQVHLPDTHWVKGTVRGILRPDDRHTHVEVVVSSGGRKWLITATHPLDVKREDRMLPLERWSKLWQ